MRQKKIKLFLPLIITSLASAFDLLTKEEPDPIRFFIGAVIIGAVYIYYLRFLNDHKYLINQLSVTLALVWVAHFLMNIEYQVGNYLFMVFSIIFGVIYLVRYLVTTKEYPRAKIKLIVVLIYCFGNIAYANMFPEYAPLSLGHIGLAIIYFWDRLVKIKQESTTANKV